MEVSLKFSNLEDAEKRELAGLLLDEAERRDLAVRLPERTMPYKVKEAAAALGVCDSTIYNMIEAGSLELIRGLAEKRVTAPSLHALRDGRKNKQSKK